MVKNKVAPPFKFAEFDIMYGKGISKSGEILDIATALEIVERSGAWYYYGGNRIAQGRDNAKKFIEMHADISDEIEQKIRDKADELSEMLDGASEAVEETAEADESEAAEADVLADELIDE